MTRNEVAAASPSDELTWQFHARLATTHALLVGSVGGSVANILRMILRGAFINDLKTKKKEKKFFGQYLALAAHS